MHGGVLDLQPCLLSQFIQNPFFGFIDCSPNLVSAYTNLHSKIDRGGKEEATQAYDWYVEETDDAANKGI